MTAKKSNSKIDKLKGSQYANMKLAYVASLSVILLAVYFIVLPVTMADGYQKKLRESKSPLINSISKVNESWNAPIFATDLTAGDHRIEDEAALKAKDEQNSTIANQGVAAADKARDEAIASLSTDGKRVTSLIHLPLLTWNKKYKEASDLDNKYEELTSKTAVYLADYKNIIDFFKSETANSDALSKVYYQEYAPAIGRISPNDLPGGGELLQPVIDKVKSLSDQYLAINPPPALKEYKELQDSQVRKDIADIQSFIDALKANDRQKAADLIIKGSDDATADAEDAQVKVQIEKYRTQSDFSKQIESIKSIVSQL